MQLGRMFPHMAKTVIEQYCSRQGIPATDFKEHLLRHSLHAPARLLRPLLRAVAPNVFDLDLTYLSCVARIQTLEQLQAESQDFRRERANRRFSRRVLHLRVSVQRVHDTVAPLLS